VAQLESQSLFASVQSAYRAAHSTETALLTVLNDLLTSVDNGDAVILALLDRSAAFDTLDHGILLDHLSARFGVAGLALAWFTSYLDKRQQSVSVNGVSSFPTHLRCSARFGARPYTLHPVQLPDAQNSCIFWDL
jgi:hypothetical protein